MLPERAVIVMGYTPRGVLPLTEIVTAELPTPGLEIELLENRTVVPVGTPVAVRSIELLKPGVTTVVTVALPFAICATRIVAGEVTTAKSGAWPKPTAAVSEITAATAIL